MKWAVLLFLFLALAVYVLAHPAVLIVLLSLLAVKS